MTPDLSNLATVTLRRLSLGQRAFAYMLPGARKGEANANTLRVQKARQAALAELRACGAIEPGALGPAVTPRGFEIAARVSTEWTTRELKILKRLYPFYGGRVVTYRTGRSLSAVTQKARRLGLVHFEQPTVSAINEKLGRAVP